MKRVATFLSLWLLGAWLAVAGASFSPVEFDDPALKARYQSLLHELRCTVCMNQSLADSGAGLADDLRREVYQQVSAGASEREVIDFMVSRYGEFVLYRPPVRPATYLLWGGPFALLLFGLIVLYRTARGSRPTAEEAAVDAAALERARRLLEQGDNR